MLKKVGITIIALMAGLLLFAQAAAHDFMGEDLEHKMNWTGYDAEEIELLKNEP